MRNDASAVFSLAAAGEREGWHRRAAGASPVRELVTSGQTSASAHAATRALVASALTPAYCFPLPVNATDPSTSACKLKSTLCDWLYRRIWVHLSTNLPISVWNLDLAKTHISFTGHSLCEIRVSNTCLGLVVLIFFPFNNSQNIEKSTLQSKIHIEAMDVANLMKSAGKSA